MVSSARGSGKLECRINNDNNASIKVILLRFGIGGTEEKVPVSQLDEAPRSLDTYNEPRCYDSGCYDSRCYDVLVL